MGKSSAGVLLMAAGILLIAGCRPQQAITAGNHQERREAATWRADTVIVRDSVAVSRAADTVYVTRVRSEWRTRIVADTVRVCVADTVRVSPPAAKGAGAASLIRWLVVLVVSVCVLIIIIKK